MIQEQDAFMIAYGVAGLVGSTVIYKHQLQNCRYRQLELGRLHFHPRSHAYGESCGIKQYLQLISVVCSTQHRSEAHPTAPMRKSGVPGESIRRNITRRRDCDRNGVRDLPNVRHTVK
jgi:hypothetical protein